MGFEPMALRLTAVRSNQLSYKTGLFFLAVMFFDIPFPENTNEEVKTNNSPQMPRVGFEPTRANTFDLKSNPLDRSGIVTLIFDAVYFLLLHNIYTYILFIYFFTYIFYFIGFILLALFYWLYFIGFILLALFYWLYYLVYILSNNIKNIQ
jgi:hypothetical protein